MTWKPKTTNETKHSYVSNSNDLDWVRIAIQWNSYYFSSEQRWKKLDKRTTAIIASIFFSGCLFIIHFNSQNGKQKLADKKQDRKMIFEPNALSERGKQRITMMTEENKERNQLWTKININRDHDNNGIGWWWCDCEVFIFLIIIIFLFSSAPVVIYIFISYFSCTVRCTFWSLVMLCEIMLCSLLNAIEWQHFRWVAQLKNKIAWN